LDPVPEFLDFWARRFQLSFSKRIRSWSRAIAIGDVALIALQELAVPRGSLFLRHVLRRCGVLLWPDASVYSARKFCSGNLVIFG
jgi:hypothetical protein